ncbi:uncharacterized protein [Anabrus simplex]|uniref:uncharacterized protein n=1 Tax=Anabrus simplex TaxID=316456 RepID=UPI0035A34788
MSRWNDEQTMKFITLYQRHTCLWQTDCIAYKDRDSRNAALENIVTEMAITGFGLLECKNKIKNLRSHYCQEIKKIYDSMRCGATGDSVYKPKLFWFPIVDGFLSKYVQSASHTSLGLRNQEVSSFEKDGKFANQDVVELYLTSSPQGKNHIIQASKKDTVTQNHVHESDDDIDESSIPQPFASVNLIEHCEPVKPEPPAKSSSTEESDSCIRTLKRKRKESRRKHYELPSSSSLSTDMTRLENMFNAVYGSDENEFDLFGRSLATQLKRMKFADALRLQLKIQTLVTEERLKHLPS